MDKLEQKVITQEPNLNDNHNFNALNNDTVDVDIEPDKI